MGRPTRWLRLPPSLQPVVALRLAFKGLLRSPGTTLPAVTILALGLAAPVTFFSLFIGATRPLPVPEGERIVRVVVEQPQRDDGRLAVQLSDLAALGRLSTLESLGAFRTFTGTILDPETAATRVAVAALTSEVLPLLRVPPGIGRVPETNEAGRTLLIGDDVWRDMYERDPSVIGRAVELAGEPHTIVGVMPQGFGFPLNQNAWVLIDESDPGSDVGEDPVELVGRLASGGSLSAADAELGTRWALADAIRDPERSGGVAHVVPYTGGSRGEAGEVVALIGLVLVALCLLLIACANVANLLLVRAAERVRALGIQAALGAGSLQIGFQLFVETLMIAMVGGAVGLAFAWVAMELVQSRGAEHLSFFWMRMAIDGPVLLFAGALVVGTALVAGTLPIVRVLAVDVQRVLKQDGSAEGLGGGGGWSRAFLTVQLALSCAALVAVGLTGRDLNVFDDLVGDLPVSEILLARVSFEESEAGAASPVANTLVERLDALPGVTAAAIALGAPGYGDRRGDFELGGVVYERPEDRERVIWNATTPGYFEVVGIELRAGRLLEPNDAEGAAPVAIVNESFVRRFSPDSDVIGRALRVGARPDSAQWHTVVGVVGDASRGGTVRARHDRVYLPIQQSEARSGMLLLRVRDDATSLAPGLRQAVAAVDPAISVWDIRTLADGIAFVIRIPRVMGAMAVAGGIAGLMVAAVGLYGLLAFRVRQRRQDLGVRLALGANGRRLARDTVEDALRQLLPAVALGLLLAWFAAPYALGAILSGIDPRSPSTFIGVAAVFLTIGLIAAVVPALRAAATDPADVLRGE